MEFEFSKEQMEIKRAAREFAEKEFTSEKGREHDQDYEFPWDFYRKAAKLGFIGASLPEKYARASSPRHDLKYSNLLLF